MVLLSQGRFISRHESNKSGRFVFVNGKNIELDGIVKWFGLGFCVCKWMARRKKHQKCHR